MTRSMIRGSPTRRWTVWTALVAAALALPGLAAADEPAQEAETHIQRGVELRRLGRNGEALVEFQRAYALAPTPRSRAQVALALQALGDWLGAEVWLEQALQGENDPWIEQYRGVLVGALATIRAHLGRLYVDVDVKEGEVLVDGVVVHSLPFSEAIHVKAGSLEVVVRAPGYAPAHRTVDVAAEAEVHEAFALEPLPPPPEHDTAPAVPTLAGRRDVDASEPRSRGGWGGYVALGAAGALAIGGVVAWRVREDSIAVWNDNSRCLSLDETRGQQCGSYETTANVALGFEIGAFVAAAASAGVGVWLLWPRGSSAHAGVAWCGPSGVLGVSCEGRF
jgi:hypothetical protein